MNSWIAAVNAAASVWLDAILRAAWQGAIVLALAWIVSRCITALPASYKVWLWRLAFFKLLVLFWLTPVSLPILPAKDHTLPITAALSAPVSQPIELVTQNFPPIFSTTKVRLDWGAWLLGIWSVGVFLALVRIARQWRSVKSLRRTSDLIVDPALNEILVRLGKTLRLRKVPALYRSPLISSPVLIGMFRPRIILPAGISYDAHIELMLAHELAHVRRGDLRWLWLFTLCEMVFFFHPLLWLARREWTISTEAACDQLALSATKRAAHDYGSMLVEVVARMTGRNAPALMSIGMFETANTLKRRLKAMTTNRSRWSTAIGVALVALATLALAPWRLVAETPDAETLARLKEENAKLKQQLDATRTEIESFRNEARATKERDAAERALDQFKKQAEQHQQAAHQLSLAQGELEALQGKFTRNHPDVIAKRNEVERLHNQVQRDSRALAEGEAMRRWTGRELLAATPEQIERSREQRALLAQEIELAEKQVAVVRRKLEVGKDVPESLLRAQREVLELKLKQAELSGSKAERHAVLLQQLQIAEGLLNEQKKRIEVGTLSPEETIAFEREVLRLKRELATPAARSVPNF